MKDAEAEKKIGRRIQVAARQIDLTLQMFHPGLYLLLSYRVTSNNSLHVCLIQEAAHRLPEMSGRRCDVPRAHEEHHCT